MTGEADTAAPAGDPRRRAVRALSAAGESVLRVWRRFVSAWQRSIQLRVVTATLALSVAVVSLLGVTLMRQVTDGLLEQQKDDALAEAAAGIDIAQGQLDGRDDLESAADPQLLKQIVQDLANRGGAAGPDVVLTRDDGSPVLSRTVRPSSVPDRLEAQVESSRRCSGRTRRSPTGPHPTPGRSRGPNPVWPSGGNSGHQAVSSTASTICSR